MAYSEIEQDALLVNHEARLNQLDGSRGIEEEESTIAGLQRDIAGLTETLNQVTILIQTELERLGAEITELQNRLDTHLGV